MLEEVVDTYPNVKAVASTLRGVRSATMNDWGGISVYDGRRYEAERREVEIFDRVGGGDSFASGFVYAFLAGLGPQEAVDYGAAHGARVVRRAWSIFSRKGQPCVELEELPARSSPARGPSREAVAQAEPPPAHPSR